MTLKKPTGCCPNSLFHTKTEEVPGAVIQDMFVASNSSDIPTAHQFYFSRVTGYYSLRRFPAPLTFTHDAAVTHTVGSHRVMTWQHCFYLTHSDVIFDKAALCVCSGFGRVSVSKHHTVLKCCITPRKIWLMFITETQGTNRGTAQTEAQH